MRQSRPKNDGRGRGVGGSWVESVFAHFDNLKSLLGFLKCPVVLVSGK